MIRDITIGQYFPGTSFLHKMDPRMKLLLIMVHVVAIFLAKSTVAYGYILLATAGLIVLSRISLKFYLKGLRPLLFLMIFSSILNLAYTKGEPLISFWVITITKEGVFTAVFMVLRILLMVLTMSVLTYTTSPLLLTGAIERLLYPLTLLHVPVHEFAMMMTIALRFVPTLLEETEKIMNAQKARGADFETGGLFRRAKALIPILIPLFISAFRRAEELAVAMECRCYAGGVKGRTRFVQYRFTRRDYGAAVVYVGLFVGLIFCNFVTVFGGRA